MISGLGFGILSWRDRLSLEQALLSYQQAGLLDLFEKRQVFFSEQCEEDHLLAKKFGITSFGADKNLGILGGFEALANTFDTLYILLVENDCPLIESLEEARAQLEAAKHLLEQGTVQVVRMRSTNEPGELFNTVEKYKKIYGSGMGPLFKRTIRPLKAQRLIGIAPYVEQFPQKKFPDYIFDTGQSSPLAPVYKVSTKYLNWTNQSVMMRRDFFLEKVIGYSKTAPTTRRVNGFRNLEIEMNSSHWRDSGWYVGMPRGIFTHKRVGDRGY